MEDKLSVRTVNQEEEGSSFIGYGSSDQGLSCSRGSVQQDSSWGLKVFEQNHFKMLFLNLNSGTLNI